MTLGQALSVIGEHGGIPDIGQIDRTLQRELNSLVRRGSLIRYRGYWDTLSPMCGTGPLKTIWALQLANNPLET